MVANGPLRRVVGLDLGEVRTGVAISDPGGSLARPLEVISSDRLVEYLEALLADEPFSEVVVGVPKTLKGEIGFQAIRVLDKLETLRGAFPTLRFVEWDERLTTRLVSSPRSGTRSGRRKKGARERVDHLAAAAMLQEYLYGRGTFETAEGR